MWARLDDAFPQHPKVVAAGAFCELIQVRAICYACRYLTDGFLPHGIIPSLLTGFEHVGIETGGVPGMWGVGHDFDEVDWPKRMVETGLWEKASGGYTIHDFLEYNPARAWVMAERKRKSEGGKLGAQRRWNKGGMAEAITPPMAPPSGDRDAPVPVSVSPPLLEPLTTLSVSRPTLSPNGSDPKAELRSQATEVLAFLNDKRAEIGLGAFRQVETHLSLIRARLADGASVQDCKSIIAMKRREWKDDPKSLKWFRPMTIFRASNFENYRGELKPS